MGLVTQIIRRLIPPPVIVIAGVLPLMIYCNDLLLPATPTMQAACCLHCRSSGGNLAMTFDSTVAHLADSFQGLPDAHAIVKPTLPSSKFQVLRRYCH